MSFPRLIPTFVLVGVVAGCTMPPAATYQTNTDSSTATTPATVAVPVAPHASSVIEASANTLVGQKARELERDITQLEQATADHTSAHSDITAERAQLSSDYFTQVAQINSRLEAGTTPGNPELVAEWQSARAALTNLDAAAAQLTDISTKFTDDTAQATYLAQSIRAAFNLRGAVDADHAALRRLAGRAASTGATLEQTLGTVLDELNRQNEMLAVEHRNLTTLSRAIEVGQLLGSNLGLGAGPAPSWTVAAPAGAPARLHKSAVPLAQPPATGDHPVKHHAKRHMQPAPTQNNPPSDAAATPGSAPRPHHASRPHSVHVVPAATIKGKPLIVIPVDTTDDSYQRKLYEAVSSALESGPSVKFLVVATAPGNHSRGQAVLDAAKAQHQADEIVRSLVAFGLPQARVQTVSTTGPTESLGAIRVFAKP